LAKKKAEPSIAPPLTRGLARARAAPRHRAECKGRQGEELGEAAAKEHGRHRSPRQRCVFFKGGPAPACTDNLRCKRRRQNVHREKAVCTCVYVPEEGKPAPYQSKRVMPHATRGKGGEDGPHLKFKRQKKWEGIAARGRSRAQGREKGAT
jgi:hypothetical protein